jgi:hypothetical protein
MNTDQSGKSVAIYLAPTAIAALAVAVWLFSLKNIAYLDIDAAQYLSAARNFLDGYGVSSSLVYYEEQLIQERMPAPQTVFPPGMPVAMAPLLATGLAPGDAAHLAGVLFFCVTGLVIAAVLHRLGASPPLTLAGTLIWYVQGTAWANVVIGRTETLFTLLVFLAVAALLDTRQRWHRYALAGAIAAAAVLIRYQGVFFIAALGLWCAWTLWRTPAAGRLRFLGRATALLSLPALATAYLIARNLVLVGSPGGGPVDTAHHLPAHGLDVARSGYWALIPFLGLSLDGLAAFRWREYAVVAGILALAVWLALNHDAFRAAPARHPHNPERVALLRLMVAYVLVTFVALGFLATRSTGYMEGRFFTSLVPLVLVAWVVAVQRWLADPGLRRKGLLIAALCALHAGLLAGQLAVARERLQEMHEDLRMEALKAALAEDFAGASLGQFLTRNVTLQSPLLATGGQQLWLLLQLPIVETTPAGFTHRVFDERELNRLSRCYGIRYLMYVPGWFRPGRLENRNQPLLEAVAGGVDPESMILRLRTPNVAFYEFRQSPPDDASNAQDTTKHDCR